MKQLYASVLVAGILLSSSVHGQAPAYEWTKTFYCTSPNAYVGQGAANSITTDASGNVYTTGWFSDTADFDPGAGVTLLNSNATGDASMFLEKLDAQGNFVWARIIPGAQSGMYTMGYTLAVDAAGNIYTTGIFHGTIDFDPGPGVFNLTSTGPRDVYVMKFDPSGNFIWAGGILGGYVEMPEISADAQGDVHLTAYYNGTLDADPGTGVTTLTDPSGTFSDFFIIKLSTSGNFLWAHSLGSSNGAEYSTSINVDTQDNVYVTGAYSGVVDFDPGPGTFNLSSAGASDVFILKLDPQGNFAWAKNVGGPNADISATVIPDTAGNIYVSGLFRGTCDFDPSSAVYNLTSTDLNGDQFVLKLDDEGNFLWAVHLMLTACGENFNLALDPSGDPYLAGNFKDSADFDPGLGTYMLYTSYPATANMFVLKLNSSGIFQWIVQVGGNDHVYAQGITIGSDYSVFTDGSYSGTPDFDPGSGTAYIPAGTPLTVFVHKLHQADPAGITENTLQNTVSVYPNPGNGIFQLTSENPQAKITTLEIYNVAGQKVFSCSPGSSTYTLDLQNQCAGIYFLRMVSEGRSVQRKLVKE